MSQIVEEPPERVEARAARPLDRGFVITIIASTAVVLFLYAVRQILLPFVVAGIVAFVVAPLVERLRPLTRGSRALAAVVVYLVLLAAFVTACLLGGPPFVGGLARTIAQLPAIVQSTVARLLGGGTVHLMGRAMNAQQVSAAIIAAAGQATQSSGLLAAAGLGVEAIAAVVLSWILLAYFMIGGPKLADGLVRLLPPPHRPLAWVMSGRMAPVLRRYFLGIFVVVVYACVASFVGLALALHLRHALLLAILSGVLELVPIAGPISSAALVGLVAVQQAKSLVAIVAFVIYAVLLRLSIDQLVAPVVLGRAAKVHPTMVIFCFLSGALLFNIVGVVLAVPVALAIKIALATIYGEPDRSARS